MSNLGFNKDSFLNLIKSLFNFFKLNYVAPNFKTIFKLRKVQFKPLF